MNTTALHGWIPEPDGRGTWSILWSCLVTISICIWSALHLKVPEPRHSSSSLIFRKVRWSLMAATAPEYILWTSASDYFRARRTIRYLTLKQKQQDWTMTHVLFAFAGGFWVRESNGQESKCDPGRLQDLIINSRVEGPPISQDELKSRAKADWFIKAIAILQILWFLVQSIARAVQHYDVTSLEILTVAFVFCSIFIYAFSFQKPQDVEYPVFIELPEAVQDNKEPSPAQDPNELGTMLYSGASIPREQSANIEVLGKLPMRVLVLLGCIFGAIHCLAWNSPFPTAQERLAWRICSVAKVAIPGLVFLALAGFVPVLVCIPCFCDAGAFFTGNFVQVIYHSVGLAYILGRFTFIILAFIGLRALPADAFKTVDWNKYFPHFTN